TLESRGIRPQRHVLSNIMALRTRAAAFIATTTTANARNARMTNPHNTANAWTAADAPPPALVDTRGRALRDLRISVTDRCNFRCTYCMPKEVYGRDFQFLERSQLLSFGEIHRMVRLFREQGVEKIRITGGEPLVRRKLERLIEMLAYRSEEHTS